MHVNVGRLFGEKGRRAVVAGCWGGRRSHRKGRGAPGRAGSTPRAAWGIGVPELRDDPLLHQHRGARLSCADYGRGKGSADLENDEAIGVELHLLKVGQLDALERRPALNVHGGHLVAGHRGLRTCKKRWTTIVARPKQCRPRPSSGSAGREIDNYRMSTQAHGHRRPCMAMAIR